MGEPMPRPHAPPIGRPAGVGVGTHLGVFEKNRASVESERAYIQSHRARDEFWYAAHFGQPWPRLQPAARTTVAEEILAADAGTQPSPSPCPHSDDYGHAFGGGAVLNPVAVAAMLTTRDVELQCEPFAVFLAHSGANLSVLYDSADVAWVQTGYVRDRKDGTTEITWAVYLEVFAAGVRYVSWTAYPPGDGTHQYEAGFNPRTGDCYAWYDSLPAGHFNVPFWAENIANAIEFQGEVYQTESRMPGTAGNRCVFSACSYRPHGGGGTHWVDAGIGTVHSTDVAKFGVNLVSGTSIEVWDKRPPL